MKRHKLEHQTSARLWQQTQVWNIQNWIAQRIPCGFPLCTQNKWWTDQSPKTYSCYLFARHNRTIMYKITCRVMPTTVHSNIFSHRTKEGKGHKLWRPSGALSWINPVVKHWKVWVKGLLLDAKTQTTYFDPDEFWWILDETPDQYACKRNWPTKASRWSSSRKESCG